MSDLKCCVTGCFKVLPVGAFGKHPRSSDGLNSRCKSCERDRAQLTKHGMTADDKQLVVDVQGGCAICGRDDPGPKGWVIDHDHACCPGDSSCPSCRRGVLCLWCNNALGYALDSPSALRRMANYLEAGTRIASASRTCDKPLGIQRTNARTKRTERVLTAVYLETAVDAGARIEDSTFISTEGTSRVAPIRAALSKEDA